MNIADNGVKPGDLPEPGDETLMARAAAGEIDAFERLMRRYQAPLFAYIRRVLGNSADAEDVFQDTFLRVYSHRQRFRTTATFRPWVYRIATNLCLDRLRYRRRRPMVSLDAATGPGLDGPSLGEQIPNGTPGPVEIARRHELSATLSAAVNALPVKQRVVFLMARYDGMPYDEIAGILRIPVGTVKSRMNTAVQFLMERLSEFVS